MWRPPTSSKQLWETLYRGQDHHQRDPEWHFLTGASGLQRSQRQGIRWRLGSGIIQISVQNSAVCPGMATAIGIAGQYLILASCSKCLCYRPGNWNGAAERPRRVCQTTNRFPVAHSIAGLLLFLSTQRSTRPEPEPFMRLSTSFTVTRLKSPEIVCFRQDAATANSSASAWVG